MPTVVRASECLNCRCATAGVAPPSSKRLVCVCLNAWRPHRGIPKLSRMGHKRYSTTLLEEGGRLLRVTNRNPRGFGFHSLRYRILAIASTLGLLIVLAKFLVHIIWGK